jgi:hypothetical protein
VVCGRVGVFQQLVMVTIEMYTGLLLRRTKAFKGHIEMEARSIALGRVSFFHLFSTDIVVTV